jgi:hypothetical protein
MLINLRPYKLSNVLICITATQQIHYSKGKVFERKTTKTRKYFVLTIDLDKKENLYSNLASQMSFPSLV